MFSQSLRRKSEESPRKAKTRSGAGSLSNWSIGGISLCWQHTVWGTVVRHSLPTQLRETVLEIVVAVQWQRVLTKSPSIASLRMTCDKN